MTTRQLNIQGHLAPIGVSGLLIRDGRISEELNNEIRSWSERFAFYREMTRDASIAIALRVVKLPLLAAEFSVVPGSDQQSDIDLAKFIERNLSGMYRQTWRSHVRDMLSAIEYGFALGEIVLEKRADGMLYLKNIEPRGQETLDRWEVENSTVTAFVQRDPVAFSTKSIPIDKLIHVTLDARKGNPEGESMLRSLYRTYKFKKLYETLGAISIERGVGGMPVVHLPEYNTLSKADIEEIDKAMLEFRRDESAYLRLPFGVQLSTYPDKPRDTVVFDALTQLKMDIYMSMFAQFLTLGTQETGTQALVQGDIDFFHLSLISLQQELVESWNAQLIPYLLLANGIEPETLEAPPKLLWADPGHTDIKGLMEVYESAAKIGLFTLTTADDAYIRSLADLPPRESGETIEVIPATGSLLVPADSVAGQQAQADAAVDQPASSTV